MRRPFTRRSLSLVTLAAATAVSVLAACGSPGGDEQTSASTRVPELGKDQKVSIVFESYNFGQAGAWTNTFNDLIGKFEKAHPNISVTAQKPKGSSPNPATDTISSIQSQIAAGSPPDVAQVGFSDLDFTIHSLGAKPLDDLFGKDAVQKNFDGAKYPYAPTARTLADWDGKTYGVPFVFSTPVLYYNASLFTKAGLDPSKPPTTWADAETAAKTIVEKTGSKGLYLDCLTKTAKDWCFQSLVRSNGGRVISSDRTTLTYDQAPAVQVVQDAQRYVKEGLTPVLSQKQAYESFARGEIGMFLETSSIQATFVKGAKGGNWDLRAARMPSYGSKPAIATNSGASLFVLSKDPAKQRAGWELIKFLTSEDAYTEISSKIGYLPLRTGLVDDPAYLQAWAKANPLIVPNIAQLDKMEPWVSIPGNSYLQVRDGMMDAVERSVYQGADPQSTLTAALKQGAALMPKA
ncbi:ABC-type sugar transport system, periplasmic component [Frankia canadensis]|uniref:ABC-type sugar transport system, periplasmic component n=1 Tax=Frankia canadensis TaxID=1836972 RepID=A0A2I2KRF3_9ACTN|nr:ABC transporter substrate-binding protein [Frankia canadensis]SNQ48247.1 ABC-type sugar transport system, periplasmic component [Frankia canadensis]SOU55537.1 ABC-type sugar transport system, periplasmic component [Frankia canadensis]